MTKTRNLYQVREFTERGYSKQLGMKLCERADALRIVLELKNRGREVFAVPVKVCRSAA